MQSKLESGLGGPMGLAGTSGGRKYGDSAGRSMATAFAGHAKKAALLASAGIAAVGYAAFKVGKDSIASASDLNESLNAVNVTYGKQSKAVKKLGRDAAESLGLSNVEFNALGVRFSSFATTIAGGPGPKVVGVLDDLTTRAGDFASVMNLDVSQAAELFQSGLAGESEPLRAYGIDLSAATVASYAYSKGIAETGVQLTQSQKVQATYGLLMKDTAKNAGDFANTSDQLANSQRILSAEWENGKAKLGKGLLPIVTDATGFLVKEGIPAFNDFSDWFTEKGIPVIRDFADAFQKKGIPAIGDFIDYAKPLANSILPAIGTALGVAKDAVEVIAPKLKSVFDGFNSLPDWVKTTMVVGAGAAALGSKLGVIGKPGAGGLVGMVTSAKPIPVFVTNPGFGAGTGTGVPGVVPKVPTVGALPKWAPFIPLGLGSAPGNDFVMHDKAESDAWLAEQDRMRAEMAKTAAAFKTLPTKLQTDIVLHGGPESRAEAKALAAQYDLTAKDRKTLFATSGIPESKKQSTDLLDLYRYMNNPVTTKVTVAGFEDARNQMLDLLGLQSQLGNHPGPSGGKGGNPRTPPRATPPGKGGVTVNIDKVEAHDYKDFVGQMQQRSQQAGMGGFGP